MSTVIDFDGPVPVYRQLADLLRAQIESGEIPPGRAIPSKRRVGEEHGIGGHTYDRAVAVLRDEGLVESVKGMGTFVRQPS
jgi:GntR family transcriptional regulator